MTGRDGARVSGSRWARVAFLSVGLVPSIWLLRRMPIGFFYMVGFWEAVAAGVVVTCAVLLRLSGRQRAEKVVVAGLVGVAAGLVLLAMIPAARADARGQQPLVSDDLLRMLAMSAQALIAVAALRVSVDRRQAAVAYSAALGSVVVGRALRSTVPDVVVIAFVALAAWRLAQLPLARTSGPRAGGAVAIVVLFTVGVAVLALQAQLLSRTSGLAVLAVGFLLGVAILLWREPDVAANRGVGLGAAAGCFAAMMFVIGVLMPSLAGGRFLLDTVLRNPDGLTYVSRTVVDEREERWYSTTLNRASAIASIEAAFRSPPVSVWTDPGADRTRGLVLGYRIEARYLEKGVTPPASAQCSTERHACVVVTVRRAID